MSAVGRHLPDQPADRRDTTQILGIALAGGTFSAVFGVGGGAVMVPLLVFWRGLNERRATGTSLLAIAIIAGYAVVSYGLLGHLQLTKGLLIGVPAVGGVIFGTWLQQRMSERVLSGMFACLLIVVIVLYLLR